MPRRAIPVVNYEVAIASLVEDIDPLQAAAQIGYSRWAVHTRSTHGLTLVGPTPRKPVPVVDDEMAGVCRGEDVDPLLATAQIGYSGRAFHGCSTRWQTLVGPMPRKPVPVVNDKVAGVSFCKTVYSPVARRIYVCDYRW